MPRTSGGLRFSVGVRASQLQPVLWQACQAWAELTHKTLHQVSALQTRAWRIEMILRMCSVTLFLEPFGLPRFFATVSLKFQKRVGCVLVDRTGRQANQGVCEQYRTRGNLRRSGSVSSHNKPNLGIFAWKKSAGNMQVWLATPTGKNAGIKQ